MALTKLPAKPMKCESWDGESELRFPKLVSVKLDGIRGLCAGPYIVSARFINLPNKHTQRLFGRMENHGLDGELIVGEPNARDVYNQTMRGVMSVEGEPSVRFFVFDNATLDLPYSKRLKAVSSPGARARSGIVPLPHKLVKSVSEVLEFERYALDEGFEGVIIRDPDAPYKAGRSTLKQEWALKLKRFLDDEAVIEGMTELQHNNNEATLDNTGRSKRSSAKAGKEAGGMMGSLVVRCANFSDTFEVGYGFTMEERAYFWANQKAVIGQSIVFKYLPIGVKDRPRHPGYKGLRHAIDISK